MILNSKLKDDVKIILRKKFLSLQPSWLASLQNNNEIDYDNNMSNYLISSGEDINKEILNEIMYDENEKNENNKIQDENVKNDKMSDRNVKNSQKISKTVTKVTPRGKIISSPKNQNREMLSYGNALRICHEISALTIGI